MYYFQRFFEDYFKKSSILSIRKYINYMHMKESYFLI